MVGYSWRQGLRVSPNAFSFQINDGFALFVVAQFAAPVTSRIDSAYLLFRGKNVPTAPNGDAGFVGTLLITDRALTTLTAGAYTTSPSVVATTAVLPLSSATTKPHVYASIVSNKTLTVLIDKTKKLAAGSIEPQDFSTCNEELFSMGDTPGNKDARTTFRGQIGEVLVYNRNLSASDVDTAIAKLQASWGVP